MNKQSIAWRAFILAAIGVFLAINPVSAAPGDLDGQNGVGLQDAVFALQVCAGMEPSVNLASDVDGDGRIGLAEAIFALRETAQAAGGGFALGDEGVPEDYDQTVLELSGLINDYDMFVDELPQAFDWRDQGVVTPAKNQGNCGGCWAFAAVGALESKILIRDGVEHDLSEQQQISCNDQMLGCRGGNAGALRYWAPSDARPMLEGCAEYSGDPPSPCRDFSSCEVLDYATDGYYTVNVHSRNEIKSSLNLDGPAYFRFNVYSDFEQFWRTAGQGAVYVQQSGFFRGGHAVLIIGWDDDRMAWLCKNSWGESAGPNRDGTFWMAYGGHAQDLKFGMANVTLASDFMLTAPNGGERWRRGNRYTIAWETGSGGNVTIELLRGGGVFATVTESTADNGIYTWQTPADLPVGDDYKIRISEIGGSGKSDESDNVFSVVGPLTVLSPNGGENWLIGSRHDIKWEPGADSGDVNIYLFKEGEGDLRRLMERAANLGTWSWLVPDTLREGDDYKIFVKKFADESVFDNSDSTFSIAFPAVAAPSNLIASDGTETDRVTISWEAATGASYYRVFRNSEMNAGGAVAVSAWQSGTVYADETVAPGTTYYYWAKAARTMSGDGASGFSNADSGYAKGCDYGVSPQSETFPASGGTGSVSVSAGSGCAWSASSNAAWITIDSGGSGTGSGTVAYSVSGNDGTSERTGTLTVAGKTVSVEHAGKTAEDEFTNSIGMTFRRIPAGTFLMGSPGSELGRYSNETQHEVTLTQDYLMQTTEVTQAQWEAVMGSNPSSFGECGGDCPVEKVSWNDVQDFIAALNVKDGRTYRLPTEAEWEYAARAGTMTAFYNGGITEENCGIDPNLDAIGWYCGNSGGTTHPVAQKQPNAWGLYDMSGNVWEWVQDWYGDYPENASVDPVGPSDASYRVYRVIRGGSWYSYARGCRSARRTNRHPTDRSNSIGFRLALSPGR